MFMTDRSIGILNMIEDRHPMIHAITNSVTIESVVNMILASGATAIGADSPMESAEITALSDGLLLNMGTPSESRLQAMLLSGEKANRMNIPILLDPVGAGASSWRREFLGKLLGRVHVTVIRGNMAELRAIRRQLEENQEQADNRGGVEALPGVRDLSDRELMDLSARLNAVLAVTGKTDFAVSPEKVLKSWSGSPMQKRITGSGCMLSGLMAALLASSQKGGKISTVVTDDGRDADASEDCGNRAKFLAFDDTVELVHEALEMYGQAAETAEKIMQKQGLFGTAAFHDMLLNVVSDPEAARKCL